MALVKRKNTGETATFLRELGYQFLIKKQKGLCYWCERPLGRAYEVEHLIPLSRGGATTLENIRIACRPCNSRKGTMMPDAFRQLLIQDLI